MAVEYSVIVKIIDEAGTQIDMDKLNETADLIGIGADSLDIMNILLGVQEFADIEIPDEDVEKLVSIKAICDYLDNIKTSG